MNPETRCHCTPLCVATWLGSAAPDGAASLSGREDGGCGAASSSEALSTALAWGAGSEGCAVALAGCGGGAIRAFPRPAGAGVCCCWARTGLLGAAAPRSAGGCAGGRAGFVLAGCAVGRCDGTLCPAGSALCACGLGFSGASGGRIGFGDAEVLESELRTAALRLGGGCCVCAAALPGCRGLEDWVSSLCNEAGGPADSRPGGCAAGGAGRGAAVARKLGGTLPWCAPVCTELWGGKGCCAVRGGVRCAGRSIAAEGLAGAACGTDSGAIAARQSPRLSRKTPLTAPQGSAANAPTWHHGCEQRSRPQTHIGAKPSTRGMDRTCGGAGVHAAGCCHPSWLGKGVLMYTFSAVSGPCTSTWCTS